MKIRKPVYPLFLLLIIVWTFAGCRKTKDEFVESNPLDYLEEAEHSPARILVDSLLKLESSALIPFPASGEYNCLSRPLFNDPVLFNLSKDGKDYIVKIDNNPGVGRYYSWPQGLALDSVNGSINVSASQSGYRYAVGFVKAGTKDTCLQNIIISGASYKDSIYVIGNNDTLVQPYFNADPNSVSICDASGDEDYPGNSGHANGNHRCEFDAEDNNGNKGRANKKHVKVRTVSGVINLKKTLEEGAFGSVNPPNGQGLIVPVYYKLNDKGGKALQKVSVQLVFFNSRADIPAELVQLVRRRREMTEARMLISPSGSPRPPLIVITRS